MSRFTHLHLHTNYSVLDGAIKISKLSQRLKALEMKSCAITDHGNMFGAVKFYKELKSKGIKPIIGCEAYMTAGQRTEKIADNFHLVLLCQNKEGYKNLCKLVTTAYTEGFYYKPRIDRSLIEKHNSGLIALSGVSRGNYPPLYWLEEKKRRRSLLAGTGMFLKDVFT